MSSDRLTVSVLARALPHLRWIPDSDRFCGAPGGEHFEDASIGVAVTEDCRSVRSCGWLGEDIDSDLYGEDLAERLESLVEWVSDQTAYLRETAQLYAGAAGALTAPEVAA